MTTTEQNAHTSPTSRTTGRPSRWGRLGVGVLIGLGAGAVTLGVAEVAAAVINPTASPVLAVGDAFVDATPEWLKQFAISTFGENDKIVLLAGIAAVVTVLAAVSGVLALRSRRLGAALPVLLVVAAAGAALTRPGAAPLDIVPALLGGVAGVATLLWLAGRATATSAAGPDGARTPRRTVLAGSLAALAVGGLAGAAGQSLGRRFRNVDASRSALALPSVDDAAAPLPDGVQVEGATPFRTDNADFYRVDTALTVPRQTAEDWTLRIHGLVDNEIELDWASLTGRDIVEREITLVCVSNEVGGNLNGNAVWRGVRLDELLAEAGVQDGADMVLSTSVDGYTCSTPVAALTDGRDALLAFGMNGEPLPLEHGFPVRMVVPGLYGYVSATKWVVDLEVTRFADATAYWTDRDWAPEAPIKTSSRIDVPESFARVAAGRVAVAGVAWAPHTGLETVEVQVDGGAWSPARLAAVPSIDTWQQWVWEWDATPGQHNLRVRATDTSGYVQPEERRPPKPDGSTGWDSVAVTVA